MNKDELATFFAFQTAAVVLANKGEEKARESLQAFNEIGGTDLSLEEWTDGYDRITGEILDKSLAKKKQKFDSLRENLGKSLRVGVAGSISGEQISSLRACGAFKGKKDEQ